jgi:hypothetical protein
MATWLELGALLLLLALLAVGVILDAYEEPGED